MTVGTKHARNYSGIERITAAVKADAVRHQPIYIAPYTQDALVDHTCRADELGSVLFNAGLPESRLHHYCAK